MTDTGFPNPSDTVVGGQHDRIVTDLADCGWSVIPGFLSEELLAGMAREEQKLWEAEQFREAAIGRGDGRVLRPEIRSDRIFWLDPATLPPVTGIYWAMIDSLRVYINRTLYLGLRDFEAHYAIYPPGSFYQRHLDQHQRTPQRGITCLLYLNGAWSPADGGQLRIYAPDGDGERIVDILPEGGTLVVFRSDLIPHEVLPTRRERFSLTGWLRREGL